ncbi:hypothetical protein [Saccharothrix sp.]|uniref:hypothetical protein n=1 Tax=Saccharothrix sp. TaxID=1873460 RepID=UPI002811DD16|nr:hypothetical protein [Saccharothrix sp.]
MSLRKTGKHRLENKRGRTPCRRCTRHTLATLTVVPVAMIACSVMFDWNRRPASPEAIGGLGAVAGLTAKTDANPAGSASSPRTLVGAPCTDQHTPPVAGRAAGQPSAPAPSTPAPTSTAATTPVPLHGVEVSVPVRPADDRVLVTVSANLGVSGR